MDLRTSTITLFDTPNKHANIKGGKTQNYAGLHTDVAVKHTLETSRKNKGNKCSRRAEDNH